MPGFEVSKSKELSNVEGASPQNAQTAIKLPKSPNFQVCAQAHQVLRPWRHRILPSKAQ